MTPFVVIVEGEISVIVILLFAYFVMNFGWDIITAMVINVHVVVVNVVLITIFVSVPDSPLSTLFRFIGHILLPFVKAFAHVILRPIGFPNFSVSK